MELRFKVSIRPDLIPDLSKKIGLIEGVKFCTCDVIKGSGSDPCPCDFKVILSDQLTDNEIWSIGFLSGRIVTEFIARMVWGHWMPVEFFHS